MNSDVSSVQPLNHPPPPPVGPAPGGAELPPRPSAGDQDALSLLYRRMYPRQLRMCRKRVPLHVAEELVQDTWLRKVLPWARRQKSPSPPWRLVAVMTRRVLCDHLRSQVYNRPRQVPLAGAPHPPAARGEDALELEEVREAARRRLGGGSWPLVSLWMNGGSHGDIARALGGSAAASRKRLQRGLDTLRDHFRDQLPPPPASHAAAPALCGRDPRHAPARRAE